MNKTQIGELYINLQTRTEELEKGLKIAKKKLQEIEESNKKVEESNKGLEGSYLAMSAVAIASLVKIVGVIKDCVNEYNTYTQAMSSLQDVANHTGQSMSDFSDIMSEFSTYMTQDDLAATIKNFTLMGYSADETRKMIEALTNSAIKNRNANYTVSQAVKVASDGYKQGLSTLSDSAGVTENLSVMLDNYAKSIGKTASQLTEAEKNQAYLNRTMVAAEPFAGAMAGYMDTLAGKQGAYAQAMRETQVAYAEALEPVLSEGIVKMTNLLNVLTGFIDSNPALVSGITAGTLTLGVATVAVIALKKGVEAFSKSVTIATIKQKGFNAALEANPVIAAVSLLTTLIGVTVGITSAVESYREAQERLNEVNKIAEEIENGKYKYTSENAQKVKENVENIKKQIELQEQIIEKEREMQKISAEQKQYGGFGKNADYDKWKELDNLWQQLYKDQKVLEKQLKETREASKNWGDTIAEANKNLKINEDWLKEHNNIINANTILNTEAARAEKQRASQLVLTAKENRKYLEIVKSGNKETEEYKEAVEALAKTYNLAVSASGPIIDELETLISDEEKVAEESYNTAQRMMENHRKIIQSWTSEDNEKVLEDLANQLNIPIEKIQDELIPVLETATAKYSIFLGKTAEEMGGTYTSKKTTGGTSAYQNKALDDYKKQIEYKKNLDKISAEEEIEMYEYALRNLAKINDEKMDLEVEIYQLRKQLIEDYIDAEKEALDKRTEDSERWIEEQNLSAKEQEEAYSRIITYHKEYLDKMVADERLSLEQKNAIWREEVNLIKDYQAQIRDIRIETVDNTYEALKNALTEQANQLQEVEENAINKSLESLENSKNKKIEMINEEYNARIKAIDDELKALEDAEKAKSRLEEQEDYEKKRKRLEELIAYEHDAVTKASYEKELAKLNEDYQKTLDKQALEDKKEALNSEKENIKEEQQARLDSINDKYNKEKEYLNNRLIAIQENYDKEREMVAKNAQEMLLNTEAHQAEIINLLKTYGDEYELLGTTWGERVVEAFEEKVQGIVSTVEKLNAQINSAINSKISAISGGVTSADIAAKKAFSEANKEQISAIAKENNVDMSVAESMFKNGTTVIQNNNFNVPVEKPSTLLQKTMETFENLGELLRGAS